MIHYHGAPIGGTKEESARFFTGRHGFVSFAHPSPLPGVAANAQSFALDNGAYTFYNNGDSLDYDGFVNWVEEWYRHPGFDWAVIPDKIGGSEKENDALIEKWPPHLPGVPVWHMDEHVSRLRRLARNHSRVAIGGVDVDHKPGSQDWWSQMITVMDLLCDHEGKPPCKLHGLSLLDPEVFRHLPLASADSTNAARNASIERRFGTYTPPSTSQRAAVIADRVEQHTSAPVWKRINQHHLFGNGFGDGLPLDNN